MSSRSALARHPLALVGGVITTVTAVVFIALAIAEAIGLFENTYAGLVIFVALPALFILGLLLIPAGMWLQRRRLRRDPSADMDWPTLDFRRPVVRRTTLLIVALTGVNLVILLLAGYGSLHWMESPGFCGQACHTPMRPQFITWQNAPHSSVACTQCHIGEGARALVHYKLGGVRMLVHTISGNIPKPIPGVAELRPALEICGNCHWPGKGFGDVVRVKREYADDETNTETATILQLFLGGPGAPTPAGRAIHWHADPRVQIEFIHTDGERQTIKFVKYTDAQGRVREYAAEGTTPDELAKGSRRAMDCVDCHNVPAHRVAPAPEQAVDAAIAAGRIDRGLPFVRREGVRLMKASYQTRDDAVRMIDEELRKFYTARGGDAKVTGAVSALQEVYQRNVFPEMKVTFGTYPDNIGHTTSSGCFRCHDGSLVAKDGSSISSECEYCHKQIDRP